MPKAPSAGEMRYRIEIQEATGAKDGAGYGQMVDTWTTVATVWAAMTNPSAGNREQVYGDVETSVTRVHWTIWHRDDLSTNRHRVRTTLGDTETLYDIMNIQHIGYRDKMVLITEKRIV